MLARHSYAVKHNLQGNGPDTCRSPRPEQDRKLSPFVGWLTLTHTQRRHGYRR